MSVSTIVCWTIRISISQIDDLARPLDLALEKAATHLMWTNIEKYLSNTMRSSENDPKLRPE